MHIHIRRVFALLLIILFSAPTSLFASAYNGRPKLVVVIVVDQYRADYLQRYHDKFVPDGFRLLMDRGAYFTDCYYDYANLQTAPGHSTIATGAYSNGHGIAGNDWYDAASDQPVTSVFDANTTTIGEGAGAPGASPHNLQASTLGDELRLATKGAGRVFAVSLKDRSAILPGGFSANAAYWIDRLSGGIQTSTYYTKQLPAWVQNFNQAKPYDKYWGKTWKDAAGNSLVVERPKGNLGFYDIVGLTPFANEYELDFARELVTQEKLGKSGTTDILMISISATDILGHRVGPDDPQQEAMALELDKQLAGFFAFLGREVGLDNTWIALSADHGITYMPQQVTPMRIPASRHNWDDDFGPLNIAVSHHFPKQPANEYVKATFFPYVYLSKDVFARAGVTDEQQAEQLVGEELMKIPGVKEYFTRKQIAEGRLPNDAMGRMVRNSYSPNTTWYVQVRQAPFITDYVADVSHGTPYSYDQHVPLAFFGAPFRAGTYRTHSEPVDLAVTLASLLGLNKPTHAVGRVLVEAIREDAVDKGDKGPK